MDHQRYSEKSAASSPILLHDGIMAHASYRKSGGLDVTAGPLDFPLQVFFASTVRPGTADAFEASHVLCLDMVQIDWELNGCDLSDSAILLEIWERGAMLQISLPIPEKSSITLRVDQRAIAAEVSACRRDQNFGFLIDVNVDAPRMWFPHGYVPAWRLPADPQR